jgi:hypothetical protein
LNVFASGSRALSGTRAPSSSISACQIARAAPFPDIVSASNAGVSVSTRKP